MDKNSSVLIVCAFTGADLSNDLNGEGKNIMPGVLQIDYSDIFAAAKPNLSFLLMNHDPKAVKASLLKRELELQRLIRQMKFDQLHNSTVYKNLEKELASVKDRLAHQHASG